MTSIDKRTREPGHHVASTLEELVDEVLPSAHHELAERGHRHLGLPPVSLVVDDRTWTFDPGIGGEPVRVTVDADALPLLLNGQASTTGLMVRGGARCEPGNFGTVGAWDVVLRALLDGIPVHEPGAVDLRELDLRRAFSPDDGDDELAAHLAAVGFAHLRGWVDPGLLERVDAEAHEAAAAAAPGQPDRWWATTASGDDVCVRVQRLLDVSPAMAELMAGDVYRRIGSLFDDDHARDPERAGSCEALLKPVDVVRGLSEFPWHRDCTQGGCAYNCSDYSAGLPLHPTGGERGHLSVMAGSHRASTPAPGMIRGWRSDLPVVALATEPGDLTIHLSCTLHMTEPPRTAPRTVVYTTWVLPTEDHGPEKSPQPDLDRLASMGAA